MLANGHVLLEGVPGIAKTTMVKALARMLGLGEDRVTINGIPYKGFSRIQCTPDLLPSDVTGSLIYNPSTREFEVRLGPVFAYLLLVDEINRAVPRTQSALLEAMQERQVTIGDKTYPLEDRRAGKWFLVVATQNPVEQEGTYPLPEAQLDRFMVRIVMGYPESLEEEKEIYRLHKARVREPVEDLDQVLEPGWLAKAQEVVATQVDVTEEAVEAITRIIRYTRPSIYEPVGKYLELGASPRAGIALMRVAQAHAALRGSSSVEPSDVKAVAFHVLNHRLVPRIDAILEYGGGYEARLKVLREALKTVMEAAGA